MGYPAFRPDNHGWAPGLFSPLRFGLFLDLQGFFHSHVYHHLSSGHRAGSDVVKEAQRLFSDTLDIEETVIVVDARKEDSEGMTTLKQVLKKRRGEMIVSLFKFDINLNLHLC